MCRSIETVARLGLALALVSGLAACSRSDDAKDRTSGRILVAALRHVEGDAAKAEYWTLELDPKSGNWREVVQGDGGFLRPSPGGRWLVVRDRDGTKLLDPRGKAKPIPIIRDGKLAPVAWSADGKQFLATRPTAERVKSPLDSRYETWRYDADGSHATRLPIPDTELVADWSPDGQWLLTTSNRHPGEGRQIYRMHPDGTGSRRLTLEGSNRAPRYAPDGHSILFHRDAAGRSNASTVWVMDADGFHARAVYDVEGVATQACWSPDGTRVAIRVVDLRRNDDGTIAPGLPAEDGHPRIEVMDLRGDHRELFPFPAGFFFGNPEWVAGDGSLP